MRLVKVTAKLADGRIATTDLALPLDSILAYSWISKYRPDLMEASKSGIQEISHPPLPLAKREANGEWWWACSFAFGEPLLEQKNYWHKRFDADYAEGYVDFQGRRGKVDTGAGYFKGYRMPLTVFLVPKLTWYLEGDLRDIWKLLLLISHIGKKSAQGYGAVSEWTVEEVELEDDLTLARPIPDPHGDEIWGIRPPYWEPKNQARVRWPQERRLAINWLRFQEGSA